MVRFVRANYNWLENTSTGLITEDFTICTVGKFNSLTGVQRVVDINDAADYLGRAFTFDTTLQLRINGGYQAEYSYSDTTNFHYWTCKHIPTSRTIYEDGVSQNTSSDTKDGDNTSRYTIGDDGGFDYPADIDIAEIAIYDSSLGDSDRALIESYFAEKYAL